MYAAMLAQDAAAISKRLKLFGVFVAADRLSLLNRKTRVLMAEVFRCVHVAHILV